MHAPLTGGPSKSQGSIGQLPCRGNPCPSDPWAASRGSQMVTRGSPQVSCHSTCQIFALFRVIFHGKRFERRFQFSQPLPTFPIDELPSVLPVARNQEMTQVFPVVEG